MKLEILDAEDKGNKIVFEMDYDWEFANAVAKIYGVKHASEEDIEDFVMMVLNDMTKDDLRKLGYEFD
jgi:2-keto-4-pentenoate hydratase/2-oxohepta-3-ene-1,7-dioic acid hydratase in catechol pathway